MWPHPHLQYSLHRAPPKRDLPKHFQVLQEVDSGIQAIVDKDRVMVVRKLVVPKEERANTRPMGQSNRDLRGHLEENGGTRNTKNGQQV